MQTYFSSTSTPWATRTVAFLTVCRFYRSLLFVKVRIYKPDILVRKWRITISELGPFREGGMGGRVLCFGSRIGC